MNETVLIRFMLKHYLHQALETAELITLYLNVLASVRWFIHLDTW